MDLWISACTHVHTQSDTSIQATRQHIQNYTHTYTGSGETILSISIGVVCAHQVQRENSNIPNNVCIWRGEHRCYYSFVSYMVATNKKNVKPNESRCSRCVGNRRVEAKHVFKTKSCKCGSTYIIYTRIRSGAKKLDPMVCKKEHQGTRRGETFIS